jgi:hypothetical protein
MIIHLILTASGSFAVDEVVYPAGSNIVSRYLINTNDLEVGDTLIINRILINNAAFNIDGLYFSENLPPDFNVVGHSAKINGVDITYSHEGPLTDYIQSGFNGHLWVIDAPGIGGSPENSLVPGDSLDLQYKIVCNDVGEYILPLRCSAFMGDINGCFAYSDTINASYTEVTAVVDDPGDRMIPDGFLRSRVYPNPFNSTALIRFAGIGVQRGVITLEIYDITGRKIQAEEFYSETNPNVFRWSPESHLGSGLYFYQIRYGQEVTSGKMILLK